MTSATSAPFSAGRARAREEQLVVGGHAAARQAVEEDGDAAAPRPARAARSRRGPSRGSVPAMITGRSALAPAARPRARRRRAPGRRAGRRCARRTRGSSSASHEDVVQREVDERRARSCGAIAPRAPRRPAPGSPPSTSGVARELGQRAHERDVVDLLQRPLPPAHRRRAPAEHEHRRVVLLRRADRAHPVGHAGPGRQRRHARLARDLRPALGGERGGLLVADVDDVDALLAAAVVDREEVAAREREQLRHAVGLQPPGDQPPAVELGLLLGFGSHAAERYLNAGVRT